MKWKRRLERWQAKAVAGASAHTATLCWDCYHLSKGRRPAPSLRASCSLHGLRWLNLRSRLAAGGRRGLQFPRANGIAPRTLPGSQVAAAVNALVE